MRDDKLVNKKLKSCFETFYILRSFEKLRVWFFSVKHSNLKAHIKISRSVFVLTIANYSGLIYDGKNKTFDFRLLFLLQPFITCFTNSS